MISLYHELEKTVDVSNIQTILSEHPEMQILWNRRHSLTRPAVIDREDVILHIIFEAIVEKQIKEGDPPEVRETYQKLREVGLSSHAARGNIVRLFRMELDQGIKERKVFDHQNYIRKLQFLGQNPKKLERNQLCPCGSGKKYKKCCMSQEQHLKVFPNAGVLLLGADAYFRSDYLEQVESDPQFLEVKNRIHLAEFLEKQEDLEGTLLYLQENVMVFEKENHEPGLENALQDVIFLCMKYPQFASTGLENVERLISLNNSNENLGMHCCDKADLLAILKGPEKAEQEYLNIFQALPEFNFARYRYALFLNEWDQKEKAIEILRALVNLSDQLDKETQASAQELLDELCPPQQIDSKQ